MHSEPGNDVTQLLKAIDSGDDAAKEKLIELAYDELRALAASLMRSERAAHTLQPTALVHEAALKFFRADALRDMRGRAHFFGSMALAMRRILVDHARRSGALRRGGDQKRVPLDVVVDNLERAGRFRLIDLDEKLEQLQQMNRRQSDVVTLRFFGGLEMTEIAEQLDVSLSTVEKDWRVAKAWLRGQLVESGS